MNSTPLLQVEREEHKAQANRDELVELIARAIRDVFGLKPREIIDGLDLLRPIYEKTAAYGHFGRSEREFTWERTDRKDAPREAAGLRKSRAA